MSCSIGPCRILFAAVIAAQQIRHSFSAYSDMYMITKFIISKRNAETDSIYLKVADGAVLNIKAKSIDEQGNLLDGYSFVGVKLNIRSEKELNINTASFVLRGISKDGYFDASCFYQDGERALMSTRAGSPWYIRGRQSSQSDFLQMKR